MNLKLKQAIDEFIATEALSGTSLIMTVFGDSIYHHGGIISLASLIQLMDVFGLNERSVRTAVFRLVQNGWLVSEKIGRTSYYRVTESSRQRFILADAKIYNFNHIEWDQKWDLVLLSSVEIEAKQVLKKELEWLGFANIASNVMAYPGCDHLKLQNLLLNLNMTDQVVIFKAETLQLWQESYPTIKRMVETNWAIIELHARYEKFIQDFREFLNLVESADDLDSMQAFQIRTLLIHQFRRILLKDPDLPFELLPSNWLSLNARNLSSNLYQLVITAGEEYFMEYARTSEGSMPPVHPQFYKRFGGLKVEESYS
ncbi:PaaX family transcriptional regulator C-terminal domain-containing protein [Acinetobacter sichuanensis]|uniref:PaaX family transcriptional regulator C-terminal domain-containing protein n=1 Tax=Acinetobacter sichuanensis TaxID=2136183 RepID=A0A371YM65_9GAMM|nr:MULTISPECIES: PaaX family transcriptional regulator C-terminal domain-containing protein [Acinetobacter]MDM1248787.1 phenylacetic acid degradation operon negative regulatory protein PaaX [Acinetobacter sp. R933-2]MDM1767994.1 phenylacetic acid degradation operon negative regulatory protein PaaX [Acinetobacter sp. 226-4]MDQ9022106.1 PaaX family transcriptional regulator C-terminal domain-containing protein [Acinetobacter sichuanensis]RFC82556.1 phenylacetic acid degradation operon negative re